MGALALKSYSWISTKPAASIAFRCSPSSRTVNVCPIFFPPSMKNLPHCPSADSFSMVVWSLWNWHDGSTLSYQPPGRQALKACANRASQSDVLPRSQRL